jgi:hypothetical protein
MPAFSLVRLLAMLALLLMPLAMAGQGHAAAATPHHAAAASPAGHHHQSSSPEQEEQRKGSAAQCMMACAALPAFDAPLRHETEAPSAALFALPVRPITGLAPEAETPPPRPA